MKKLLVVLLLAASIVTAADAERETAQSTHACLTYPVNELPEAYGTSRYGYGPEANLRDLTFVKPLPSPESLSHEEKYMLAGLQFGPRSTTRMPSWRSDIYRIVSAYYSINKTIPERLDVDVIAAVFGEKSVSNPAFELLKSPITGEYPQLQAQSFTPGSVYIRVLTADEIDHFCKFDPLLDQIVNKGFMSKPDGSHETVTLNGPIFYIRVYGYRGVIGNTLDYGVSPVATP